MITSAGYNFIVKYGEVTPDGVAVYDLNSRSFVYLNRFLREMVGVNKNTESCPGEAFVEFVHPDDLVYVDQRYREMLSIGCIAPIEFRIVHPVNGIRLMSVEVLWLEESYTFAIFAKDITMLRQYESYVEKISAQKDTLLDILLHNLSGPLYFSRDLLRTMSAGESAEASAAKMVSMLSETNHQCIEIINQFLHEEHNESLSVAVRKVRFDILEKSSIVLNLLAGSHKEKKLALRSALPDNHIVSDPVKYFQVLHNLLSNAVKYTDDQGEIVVKIDRIKDSTIIRVSDNGSGVPENIRDDLFLRKVKGAPGRNGEPSRGIGLFISHRLVKLMGGTLRLESTGPQGSVFLVTLPDEII